MLSQSLRVTRAGALRAIRPHSAQIPRTFATSSMRAADPVQDMYLKHLRDYRPTPVKPSDAEGHVHKFTPPKVPASPEEANLASDLKAYNEQTVEVEGQQASETTSASEPDWFEEEEDFEAMDRQAEGGGH